MRLSPVRPSKQGATTVLLQLLVFNEVTLMSIILEEWLVSVR
jgi:hypothetical protein